MPWLVRFEQEANRKLFDPMLEKNLFVEHVVTALLRGDQKSRAEFYRTMFNLGTLSPNDIRDLENLNPITEEGADKYYIQLNMTTLEKINQEPEVEEPPVMPLPTNAPEEEEEEEENDNPFDSLEVNRPILSSCALRLIKKEIKATDRSIKKFNDRQNEYSAWAEKFFAQQKAYYIETFEPVFTVMNIKAELGVLAEQYKQDSLTRGMLAYTEKNISFWETEVPNEIICQIRDHLETIGSK